MTDGLVVTYLWSIKCQGMYVGYVYVLSMTVCSISISSSSQDKLGIELSFDGHFADVMFFFVGSYLGMGLQNTLWYELDMCKRDKDGRSGVTICDSSVHAQRGLFVVPHFQVHCQSERRSVFTQSRTRQQNVPALALQTEVINMSKLNQWWCCQFAGC